VKKLPIRDLIQIRTYASETNLQSKGGHLSFTFFG
jgi:hypothetical protein